MTSLIKKIKSKYIQKVLFDYVPLNLKIEILKYNKNILYNNINREDLKKYLILKKIIKPIANCEDYLSIINRIFSNKKINDNLTIFCNYLNKNGFIPQINKINDNKEILNYINSFKIGFNNEFIDNFYDNNNIFEFIKLYEFCNKYGNKLKEITLMDNNIPNIYDKKECYFILKYIIKNSNIEKIEDRHFDGDKSLFLKIFDLDYNEEIYEHKYTKEKNQKDIIDIIKGIKYYSLYFDEHLDKNKTIKNFIDIILLNALKLEELKITQINKENSSYFAKLLKNLNNLKVLSIYKSDDELLFNNIANVIKDNSLFKLEMNLNYFDEGINIINKNLNSLRELTIKINHKKDNNNKILKVLSNIVKLNKLKIFAKFPIIYENNINYLEFNLIEFLEIPIYIKHNVFDFNSFFEKLPKLKILKFNGIHFSNKIEILEQNINILKNYKLDANLIKNLQKIKFINCQKNSSFFIIKVIQLLSETKIKDNITEIKIENCEFDENININNLFESFLHFKNITNLHLNNIIFKKGQNFYYDKFNNFQKLEKLYFKGLDCEQNNIHLLSFLSYLSEKCKYLSDIGLSCKKLNSDDMNLILPKLKNFKFISKIHLFDGYTISDYFSFRDKNYIEIINLNSIDDYYLIDIRDINIKKENNYKITKSTIYPKIFINDYIKENKNNKFCNKSEKYYSYQNLFSSNSHIKILHYSHNEKSFILSELINKEL